LSLGTAMWVVVGLAAFIALEALVIVKGARCERPVWGVIATPAFVFFVFA
jgi:hypothetical protein